MKRYKNILVVLSVVMLTGLLSCQLVEDIDDFEPLYSLEGGKAIVDEASAENALNGIYAKTKNLEYGILSRELLSGNLLVGGYYNSFLEIQGWALNNPPAQEDTYTLSEYSTQYNIINNCNWLIQEAAKLNTNDFSYPERLAEIIGEAKLLRGFFHFELLKTFGQFYDHNSMYGIDIRLEPAKNGEAHPRRTVVESYTAILEDIEAGIDMAPELREHKGYVNKSFAKGLKAKVLLYMGDYNGAASAAKDLIDNASASFALNSTYEDIFYPKTSTALFEHPELLFGFAGTSSTNSKTHTGSKLSGGYFGYEPYLILNTVAGSLEVDGQIIDFDNHRFETIFTPADGYEVRKYSISATEPYELNIQLRMAEVYLILAEADARAKNTVTSVALDALNAVRIRAGATTTGADGFETYPENISLDQFLTAVRQEKAVELFLENGETWFDLIRYDYIDGFGTGFQVSDVKPTATNPDKFILPIPYKSYAAGIGITIQNPSYE